MALLVIFTVCGFARPERLVAFESPVPRTVLCLSLALYLALFLFILYPQKVVFPIPGLDATVRIMGPAALWVGLFLFLLKQFPAETIAYFTPHGSNGTVLRIPYDAVTIKPIDFTVCNKAQDSEGFLSGVYVHFPPGQTQAKAEVAISLRRPIRVMFKCGEPSFKVDLVPQTGPSGTTRP